MGLIETRGYTPLVTAVDGALKAAQVNLVTATLVGGGLATAALTGDVGSVQAALSAARAIIAESGVPGMTHVIARPDAAVWAMLAKDGLKAADEKPEGPPPGGEPATPTAPPAATPESQTPAVRPRAEAPQAAPAAEVPAVREAASVPAERVEPEVPAVREKAGLPVATAKPGRPPAEKPGGAKTAGKDKARKKPAKPTKK